MLGVLCRYPDCRTPQQPGYAPRSLCTVHESDGLDAVRSAADDFDDLQPLVWDKPASGLAVAGGAFGPRIPIDVAADALSRQIAYTAVWWETIVRDRARLSPVGDAGQPDADDVSRACGILTEHFSVLLALPTTDYLNYDRVPAVADGPDVVVEFIRLHRSAQNRVGITSLTRTVPGWCSACNLPTLRHRDGAETVFCAHCHAVWHWNVYDDAVNNPSGTP